MFPRQHLWYHLLTAILVATLITPMETATVKRPNDEQKPSESAAFEFAYETKDEEGNLQMHREQQDSHGRRVGTYGYRHANGIYRFVDYVADSLGYRATIRTNEPGTQTSFGSGVNIESSPAPAGIIEEDQQRKLNRFTSKAIVEGSRPQHFTKHPPVPLPLVVVSPVTAPHLRPPSTFGAVARSDPDEVPRTPEEPPLEAVHAADVVQTAGRRASPPRGVDSALLFPAPPLIRPPRYRPRTGKALQPGFIEAAFRRRRS